MEGVFIRQTMGRNEYRMRAAREVERVVDVDEGLHDDGEDEVEEEEG